MLSVLVWNKEENGILWVMAVKGIRSYINNKLALLDFVMIEQSLS